MRMRPSRGATTSETRDPQEHPAALPVPVRGRRRPLAGLGALAVVASLAVAVPSPASAASVADPAAAAGTASVSASTTEEATAYWTADRRADALATEGAAHGAAATDGAAATAATEATAATDATADTTATGSTPGRIVTHPGLEYVGILFYVADGRNRTCTASVVDTPQGDAIATAAHCLVDPATGAPVRLATFVPGTKAAQAPFGLWPVDTSSVTDSWKRTHAVVDDAGFARVRSLDGRTLADVVGAARPVFDRPLVPAQGAAGTLSVLGYPQAAPYSGTQLVACASVPRRSAHHTVSLPCALGDGAGGAPIYTRGARVPVRGELRPEQRSVVAAPASPAAGRADVVLAEWGAEAQQALAALTAR
ncbi:trypsin-like serine peptidase [Clavibacter sepedonicus]|nr:hypothetical protein [Clavibacter sepedonicus]OQJ46913.1 hypothetical protein B5P19_00415 [Clavibacter sepedonicus]OQJ55100.1 hypothetical protein B5P20_14105 [Clavibacter sepedonicus]UUK66440.1 serine protease [Clavibacter sepedonicus]